MTKFEIMSSYMDDELREKVHADLAPCTEEEFMKTYETLHFIKFGENFRLD
jgi:hypothetical protein